MPHSQIDEQVVKMSFDNSNFDKNINDSIKALNSLDSKLIYLNKDNFGKLTTSIDNLANTFNVKGQIMLGVLTRLGTKIYDLGHRAFGTLFKGIKDGLGEYNTIIDSTEAIYQNVKQNGNSLKDVNNALDELNDYADKTIYNFGQMTRMIGMFSSAGVGLKKSVSTIKGLSNAAALVGANMQKAQIAWNAVSRAMSSGNFTNMTWRSLELSGIAGKQFNKVITEVARNAHVKGKKTGKSIDGMIKKYGSLRETLQEKWLTKDLFTKAMDIMSGEMTAADMKKAGFTKKQIRELTAIAKAANEAATRVKTFKQLLETTSEAIGSGWAQSFRILIGDLEDAKLLYTRISEVLSDFIDNNARIRNELFEQIVNGKDRDINGKWRTGRDNFRQIIENMMATAKTFFKSIKVGFLNIFPVERISSAARKALDKIQKFTKALVLNQEEANSKGNFVKWDTTNIDKVTDAVKSLMRFFRGLAAAVDVAWMTISQPIKVIIKRIPFLNNFFENTNKGLIGILNKLGNFGDKIYLFQNAIKQTNFFGSALEILLDNIDELGKKYPVIGAIAWVFRSLKIAVNDIKNGIKKLNIKPFSTAFGVLKFIVTAVWRGLNGIFGLIQNASKKLDFSWLKGPKEFLANSLKSFSDYGKGLIQFEDIAKKVKNFFEKTFGNVRKSASDFFSMISEKANAAKTVLVNSFNSAKTSIGAFANKVKTGASDIKDYLLGVGDAADESGGKVKSVWDKVKGFFGKISDFFKGLSENSDNTVDGIIKKIALIAGAVAASAFSISTLTKAFGKLTIVSNINALLKSGVDVIKAYQREAKTKTILNIALAIGILAGALVAMSFVPYDKMENGLVMFASFMATITLTLVPLINSIALLNQSIANRKNITNVQAFFGMFTDIGKSLAKGINAKAFGKACIYFAISIGIVVAAIIALKKNFDKIEDIEKPAGIIIRLMMTMGIVIGAVSIALTILSKIAIKAKASVRIFSGFFQLVGVSHVIIAIALAIALLTQSIIALTKVDIDKTLGSVGLIAGLVSLMGLISMGVALIISQSTSFGKLKDISMVLISAASTLGIVILAYIALMKMMENSDPEKMWMPLVTFTLIIGQFTALVAVLLGLSKKVGGNAKYWQQLNKFLIVISACLTTLAGALYLLSFAGKIDDSVVNIIEMLIQAGTLITVLLSVLTAIAKTNFSTNFIKVIQGISFAISAFTAAVGILAIGLAALISVINSVDVEATDSKNASNKFIQKIEYVARVIGDSIPALKNLFFKVGEALAEVFGSLIAGFVGKIAEIIDQYGGVIDKIINLVIDIIGKVINVLYSRKTELISIFNKAADLIVSLFTNALNQAFRRGESETPIKESTVSKFLGIGAIFATFTTFAGKINTIQTFISNNAKKTADLLNKMNVWMVKGSADTARLTAGNYVTMGLAVTAAFKSVSLAFKGYRQLNGEEAVYMRRVGSFGEWLLAFFTDTEYRAQTFVYGMATLGRVLWNILRNVAGVAMALILWLPGSVIKISALIIGTIEDIIDVINTLISNLTGVRIKALDDFIKKCENGAKTLHKSYDDMWKTIGGVGFKNTWSTTLEYDIGSTKQEAAQAGKEAGTAFANSYVGATDKTISGPYAAKVSKKFGLAISGELNHAVGTISPMLINAKDSVVKGSEEVGKGIGQGMKKGVDETKEFVNTSLSTMCTEGKKLMDTLWDRHSPSKVTEELYKDVVMGGVNGINKNKIKLNKAYAKMIQEQMKIAKSGEGALEAVYSALGIKYTPTKIQDTRVDIYDYDDKTRKTVELNQQYLDIMEKQGEAFEGKSREYAYLELKRQALAKGLMFDAVQAKNVIDAVLSHGSDHFNVTMDGIQAVVEKTTLSVEDVVGKQAAAQQLAIADTMNDYNEIMNLAREHSDELIGKKKEEVQEYLYQEALKRGMTEETAKAMSKAATDELFKGKKKNATITKEELLDKIDVYEKDYKLFCDTEQAKTAFLDKMAKARAKIEESGYLEMQEKLRTGKITVSEYNAWARSEAGAKSIKDYQAAVKEYNNASKAYYTTLNAQRKDIVNRGLKTDEALKKAEEEAKKILNESESAQRGDYESLIGKMKDLLGIKVPGINLGGYNFPNKNKGKGSGKGDDDKAIKAAKDTKKKLEDQRADLTPTFDLDKLASDASKANGIVMSSLMAAQNASIGDYINRDSELNPFMKDRWQNVYNFTQNNYSPKALSRIDIYRQTERQLGMSRGF